MKVHKIPPARQAPQVTVGHVLRTTVPCDPEEGRTAARCRRGAARGQDLPRETDYPLIKPELAEEFGESMMAGFGHGTRGYPAHEAGCAGGPGRIAPLWGSSESSARSRASSPSASSLDRSRSSAAGSPWAPPGRPPPQVPARVAPVLGMIDTLPAIIWLIGAATPGNGPL
ncbi:hypothetical protein GCM10022206_57620 [Streptomyces chiangmaiensis]